MAKREHSEEEEEGFVMDEEEAFKEEMKEANGSFSFGGVLNYIVFENPLSKYVIGPTIRLPGKILSYVIPKSVKKFPSYLYRKLAGSYASADFAELLVQMKIVERNT